MNFIIVISEKMKITSNDDRELILSEVYALQNDVDMEVSMLGNEIIIFLNSKEKENKMFICKLVYEALYSHYV